MFAQFDYCLYLVKIGIVLFLRYLLHKKDFRFSLERKLFKAIIVLDAIELFISIFAYRYTHTYYIIGLTLCLKVVLDFCIFTSLLKKGKKKADDSLNASLIKDFTDISKFWNMMNILMVAILLFIALTRFSFVIFWVYIFAIVRLYCQLYIIKLLWSNVYKQPDAELIEKKHASDNVTNKGVLSFFKILRYGAYICIFILLMVLRNTYTKVNIPLNNKDDSSFASQKNIDDISKEYELQSIEDNIYQYKTSNKIPSWSIFYHEKYGLINSVTGENTGAKYDNYLSYDKSGIAYDNDRHFIDTSGKEILKVPYIVSAKTSYRQELFNKLMKSVSDGYSYYKWDDYYRSEFISYFDNGLAIYYTEYNEKYGLIKDDGSLISFPKFSYIKGSRNYEVFTVSNYYGGDHYIIDATGRKLQIKNLYSWTYYENARIILVNDRYLYSFDGDLIDEGYFEPVKNWGDITCFIKEEKYQDENCTLEVYSGNAELIFSSDLYDKCDARADENGAITYMVAHNENGEVLIDPEGNLICPNTYSEITITKDFNTFLGINSDYRIDIIRLDGTIIKTDYRIIDIHDISSTYRVRKMDDDNLYNEMDLNGNLLGEWIEDEDTK